MMEFFPKFMIIYIVVFLIIILIFGKKIFKKRFSSTVDFLAKHKPDALKDEKMAAFIENNKEMLSEEQLQKVEDIMPYNVEKIDSNNKVIGKDAIYYLKGKNGQLYVYDNKIVIDRKGFWGTVSQGRAGTKTIPMKSIQSVQYKKGSGMLVGYIQFGVLGGVESTGRGGLLHNSLLNATDDENSVTVYDYQDNLATQIAEFVESKILDDNSSKVSQTTIIQEQSAASEVIKLKELLDMNIITEEEFESKKKELLNL